MGGLSGLMGGKITIRWINPLGKTPNAKDVHLTLVVTLMKPKYPPHVKPKDKLYFVSQVVDLLKVNTHPDSDFCIPFVPTEKKANPGNAMKKVMKTAMKMTMKTATKTAVKRKSNESNAVKKTAMKKARKTAMKVVMKAQKNKKK